MYCGEFGEIIKKKSMDQENTLSHLETKTISPFKLCKLQALISCITDYKPVCLTI